MVCDMLVVLLGLAYVMWRPVSAGEVLYPVLAAMAAAAVIVTLKGRLRPVRSFQVATLLVLVAVTIGSAVGYLRDAPGLNQQMIQWFGALVIWAVFANAFTERTARRTVLVIMWTTIVVAGTIVLFVVANLGLIPQVVPQSALEGQSAGFVDTDSGTAIRWLGLSTLAAAGPLAVAAALVGRDRILPGRAITATAAIIAIVGSAFAGRRAILLVVIFAPVATWVVRWWLNSARKPQAVIRIHPGWAVASPLLLLVVLYAAGTSYANRTWGTVQDAAATYVAIGSGSKTTKSADDFVRIQQSRRLLNGWVEQPLIGHGLGAVIPGYARNTERPWMFEMQYHQLLFNLGLVGAVLLVAAGVIAAREIRRAARLSPQHAPALTATSVTAICLLAANASNPYLQAVGHGWGIALAAGVTTAVARAVSNPQSRSASAHANGPCPTLVASG
jgi:hypothetical protein